MKPGSRSHAATDATRCGTSDNLATLGEVSLIKVIIDTDPGTDDALALMMALRSPELDVLGITTVGGNATLAHTTRNALRLVEYLDQPMLPVSRGSARPLKGRFHYAYHFHGAGGLTAQMPLPQSTPHLAPAPTLISEISAQHPSDTTIIALGPLTNVAKALQQYPVLTDRIKRIFVMGGAMEVKGNINEYAEFNINNDPLAANLVMSSGIPISLIGLDVCTKVYVTREDNHWISGKSKRAILAKRILANWFNTHPDHPHYYLCDPLTIAVAIKPDLVDYMQANVTVETNNTEQMGKTIATNGPGPIGVAITVDSQRSKTLIGELLSDPD